MTLGLPMRKSPPVSEPLHPAFSTAAPPDATVEVFNVELTGHVEGRLADADVRIATLAGDIIIKSFSLRAANGGPLLGYPSWRRQDATPGYVRVVELPMTIAAEIRRQFLAAYEAEAEVGS
jgi:hypothetical protein